MRAYFFLFFCCSLFSNPTGEHIVSGKLNIALQDKQLTVVQTSEKAIVEWKDFSIGINEKVHIHQNFPNGAILNRVISQNPSKILGSLESNGFVYLINEHGILIGRQGKVQAKGFLASCLNLKNDLFLEGKTLFFEGNKEKELVNLGKIQSSGGDVFLFAQTVKNKGTILAEKANSYLVGSEQIYLTEDRQIFVNPQSIGKVENKGTIQAIQAHLEASGGSIYSCAISQQGVIEANGVEKRNGRIVLKAHSNTTEISGSLATGTKEQGGSIQVTGGDEIHVHDTAVLCANGTNRGGEILIGGDYQGKNSEIKNTKKIWIGEKTIIEASALELGDGGRVIVWGDEQNLFGGTILAKGGSFGGDGGFVEVSSKNHLMYRGSVFTNAPKGKTGTLFIDPSDITINTMVSSPAFPTSPGNYNPAVASATLNNSDLVNVTDGLGNNNVTISTSGGVGGAGNVTFAADVTWSANTTLTVNADKAVIVNSGVTLSNTSAASNFTAFDLRGNEAGLSSGTSIGVDIVGSISTVNGNINLVGRGGTLSSNFGIYLRNTSTGLSSTGTGVNAGTITLNGTGGSGASSCVGVFIQGPGDRITSVDGNVSISAQAGGDGTSSSNTGILVSDGAAIRSTGISSNAATLTLDGMGGPGTSSNRGIEITGSGSGISSVNGDISLTGVAGTSSSSENHGDYLALLGFIESTGTGVNAATIMLDGTGGGTAAGRGVYLFGIDRLTSVDGNISLIGLSNGTANASDGVVLVNSSMSSTGVGANAAMITVNGTAGGTAGSGIEFFTNGGILSVDGDIDFTLTGVGAESGFDMTQVSAFVGDGTTTGDISITTNTMVLNGTLQSSGLLTIQPDTTAGTIGLGNSAVGTLNLTSTEIGNITNGFSSITFGRTTQDSTVDMRAVTYNDPVIVYGKQIEVNDAISAGANDVTLNIGPASSGILNLDAVVTTSGTFLVNGGSSSDAFNINVAGQTATVNGAAGTNTLTGPNAVNTWTITADDAGTLDSITFSNIQNLVGNSSTDGFIFNGAFQITGSIDGSTGANTVTGPNVANTWAITADDTGTITPTGASGATSLTNITNFTGGSSTDVFTFDGAFQLSGSIDGGSGSNTINGPNVDNVWAVTSQTTGTLTPTGATGPTSYSNVSTLVGNSADDTFNLSPDITLPSITAGAGTDTLTFLAGWTIPATVDLNTTVGFEIINGPPGLNNILVGNDLDNIWEITAINAGTLENTEYPSPTVFTFSNFPNLTGGSQNDTFDFTAGFVVSSIDGSTGTNTLLAPNAVNTWNVTSSGGGTVDGVAFANITNLTGGTLADTFIFANQQGITGSLDGGAPASLNTLDYSAFSPAAVIELLTATSGTASNLGNGFINIGNIIGNVSVITSNTRKKSRFYFTNLQLLFTELYHNRLIPEFFYRQFEPMQYVDKRKEKITIQNKKEDKNLLNNYKNKSA